MNIDSATDFTLYYSTVQELLFPIPEGCDSTAFSLSVRERLDWTQDSMCDAVATVADGVAVFQLDTFTQEFARVCQTSKFAWLEIYTETASTKTVHLQRRVRIASRAGTLNGQNPPDPVTLYYTKADFETMLANLISIGTVTTGEPDTPAAVINSGLPTSAILNFVIPKGAKGDKGDIGPSAVYVGSQEPENPDVRIWLDPNGSPSMSGGGISPAVVTLLMAILNAGVYTSDQSANIAALEAALDSDSPSGDDSSDEVTVSQSGSTLTLANVAEITSVTYSSGTLTMA